MGAVMNVWKLAPADRRRSRTAVLLASLLLIVAVACSGSGPEPTADPAGFSCEYSPFGGGNASFVQPTPEQLGDFDHFVRVRVNGHRQANPASEIFNIVTVEETVHGSVAEGETLELPDGLRVCLETGGRYYLLINDPVGGIYLRVNGPWAQFPVINNRITLHPDMRKDSLIGDLHGLDPVLFKRRFLEAVGRTDIDVD